MDKHASRPTILQPLLPVIFLALTSYLVYYGSRRIENQPVLFDLHEDPREQHNLYDTAEGQQILPTLRSLIETSAWNAGASLALA